MSFRLPLQTLSYDSGKCHEIDLCSPPWWITTAFLAYLLGPSIAFAVIGWVSGSGRVLRRNIALRLFVLTTFTVLFYLAGYAINP